LEQATQGDAVVEKLKEQPSVGIVTAVVMRAVIGRFDRFQTGKQLAKYCGVSPCNASTGSKHADAGLIEAGNDILRAMLIQLAKRLPRHVPRWKQLHAKLHLKKSANVVSAAIANRWLRRIFHEMVTKVKVKAAERNVTKQAS
jgi:transposase